jgi:hypothetical protein
MKKKAYTATIGAKATPEECSEKLNDVFTACFSHCSFTFRTIKSAPGHQGL